MLTNLLNEMRRGVRWWGEGLALALPRSLREKRRRLKRYLIASMDAGSLVLQFYEAPQPATTSGLRAGPNVWRGEEQIRLQLERQPHMRDLPVVVRLSDQAVLRKRLEYPAVGDGELFNVIAFDLDRQTPYSRDKVYFDFLPLESNIEGKREIDLFVTPKQTLFSIERELSNLGLRVAILETESQRFADHGINLIPNMEDSLDSRKNYGLRFVLLFLWLGLITLIPAKAVYDSEQFIESLKAQERTSLAKLAQLNELRAERLALDTKRTFFSRLDQQYQSKLDILAQLSQTLGDDTWVRRFDLKGNKLSIQGESKNASELPPLLEGITLLGAARFSSPVTRNNTNGLDRFVIALDVQAPSTP